MILVALFLYGPISFSGGETKEFFSGIETVNSFSVGEFFIFLFSGGGISGRPAGEPISGVPRSRMTSVENFTSPTTSSTGRSGRRLRCFTFDVTAPAPVVLGCSNFGDLCFLGRRTRCNRQTGRPDSRSHLEDAPRHRPANCRRRHALPRDVRHPEPPPICVGGCLLAGQNSKSGNIRPHPAVRGLPDEITSATLTA